jgi:hypothetical protein
LLQQRLIRVFLEDAETWVQNLKSKQVILYKTTILLYNDANIVVTDFLEWQRIQATSFEDVYLVARDPLWKMSHGKQILAYRACMAKVAVDIWQRAVRVI